MENTVNRRTFIKTACASALAACATAENSGAKKPAAKFQDNVKKLVEWLATNRERGEIGLIPDLPSGRTHGGAVRDDLKNLYWLQNCNLYAMHALRPFDPQTAKRIEASYWKWQQTAFPDCEERTENYLPVGQLPKIVSPEGKYYRVVVKKKECEGFCIGTETFDPDSLGDIKDNDPRGLLKFGALGARLRGEKKKAFEYFQKALALWDGCGFQHTRMEKHHSYYARYLAYALIVERALHAKIPAETRGSIEARLWALQDADGGIWTNYYADGSLPDLAKKTSEIGPLTLLAYNDEIWP